jgi:Flp pilus assembly protein TadG
MRRVRTVLSERGAAAVEFAIVLPVLIALLCGTIDWGYYFFTRSVVVNASREGARTGTLQFALPATPEDEAAKAALNYLVAASLDGDAVVQTDVNLNGGGCPPSSSCVRITYDGGESLTGFPGTFVPTKIVAYAEMRK